MSRSISVLALVLAASWTSACGASQAKRPRSGSEIRKALANNQRANRNKIRDLENQIVLLENRLRRPSERSASSSDPRPLPVVVRAPDQAAPGDKDDDEYYDVVGSDEEGVEIVYVGDAAREHSVSIPAPARRRLAAQGLPDDPEGEPQPPRSIQYGPSERIATTRGTGPTVEQQMRQARSGQPTGLDAGPARARPGASAPAPAPAPAPTRSAPAPAARKAAPALGPKEAYKRAYEALRSNDYERAVALFGDFMARYPGHEYADNAGYWLGETYYDQRDFQAALDQFRRVVTEYPEGNKVPDALLKMGYCHLALGDEKRARKALAQVVEHHPETGPAKLAARRLDSIRH